MQSGPIRRELYVRLHKHINCRQNNVWKLLRLSYGIVEAGQQWLCAIEEWLVTTYKAERITGVDQLFLKKGEDGRIILLIAKVVDDFFLVVPPPLLMIFYVI